MIKTKFKVGDKVKFIGNSYDNLKFGMIVDFDENFVAVSWDNFQNGHSCDGKARKGSGWNVGYDEIILTRINWKERLSK